MAPDPPGRGAGGVIEATAGGVIEIEVEATAACEVRQALARVLADHGVTTLFGVLGDGNMFVVDSFVHDCGGRYVAAAHETGATLMAMGHGSAAGGAGVVTVTHGPGLANTLPALISAAREHSPLLVLTGDIFVPGHTQNIDQRHIVAPTGAGYVQASSAAAAPAELAAALTQATAERRPVVFALPAKLNFAQTEYAGGEFWTSAGAPSLSQPADPGPEPADLDPDELDTACGIIASATRPVVLGGLGAVPGRGAQALRRLADALGAPMATTLPAKGLFGDDENDLGVFGSFSSAAAVEAILASDCIIALGTSLSRLTGGGDGWAFFQDKAIVRCDLSADTTAREFPLAAAVTADAATFADAVVRMLGEAGYAATGFRRSLQRSAAPAAPARAGDDSGPVDAETAMRVLNQALPADRCITVDGGRFTRFAVENLTVPSARQWMFGGRGLGAIGLGLPEAIGLASAFPHAPAVSVIGDGAFMLGGLAEFNTAVRHGLDLIVVVCNDGAYGAEFRKLKRRDCGVDLSLFAWPEFSAVAQSLGGTGFAVRSPADLAQLPAVIAGRRSPLLIDIKLDPASVPD